MKTIYYPIVNKRTATKAFNCSSCQTLVSKGETYYKTHHGRYCSACLAVATEENNHKGVVQTETN